MQKISIKKEDYERYTIPLPVSKLIGKTRQNYIYSELEKRHPCFTKEFHFDASLRFSGKGIFSDVIVIDRRKLLDFKNKNKCLFGVPFEGCKSKRFISGKQKILPAITGGILLIVMGFVFIERIRQKFPSTDKPLEIHSFENSVINDSAVEIIEQFFLVIQENDVNLNWLNIRREGRQLFINGSICSLYPEAFENLKGNKKFSAVNYVAGVPEFTFAMEFETERSEDQKTESYEKSWIKEIREVFAENNIQIVSENLNPRTMSFEMGKNMDVLKVLEKILEKNDVGISSIKIRRNESGLQEELQFNQFSAYSDGINLRFIYENENRFLIPEIKKKKNQEKEVITVMDKEEGEKLGEILHSNGTKVIFYRGKNGKLVKKMEAIK